VKAEALKEKEKKDEAKNYQEEKNGETNTSTFQTKRPGSSKSLSMKTADRRRTHTSYVNETTPINMPRGPQQIHAPNPTEWR